MLIIYLSLELLLYLLMIREAGFAMFTEGFWGIFLPSTVLIGISLIHAVGYGALAALCGALAVFTVQPVYIFTEWVPENFVAWSSISKVFWNLTQTAAGLVRVGSRELRVIAFWGGALMAAFCIVFADWLIILFAGTDAEMRRMVWQS